MFHRVLPADDPRFAGADPEWTLTDSLFRECLEFFREHYSVVRPQQVEELADGGAPLPDCPLLLTFDDGWADNAEFALPILQEFDLAGYVFVVSGAVGCTRAFWQEQLFSAWKQRRLSESQCATLWFECGGTASDDEAEWRRPSGIRRLIARLEKLPEAERERVLRLVRLEPDPESPAQMVTREQVLALQDAGMSIGSHGATHTPFTVAPDREAEIRGSRDSLEELLGGPVKSLSFPHGRYDEKVAEECRSAGYELLFTSDECLNDLTSGALPRLLGRVNIPAHEISASDRRLARERLATWLFGREVRCLAP
jgi:peptidoglycan/xylan/chitin deacetylase (PgdA/CDA1 family)